MEPILLFQYFSIMLFFVVSVVFLFLINKIRAFEELNFKLFVCFSLLILTSVLLSFLSDIGSNTVLNFFSALTQFFANMLFLVSSLTLFGGIFQLSFLVKKKEGEK